MDKELKILFLSAIDFKEKSIQVIKKTPEAYYKSGWIVDYIVGRDTSIWGNYKYEVEFNPEGTNVTRIRYPLEKLRNSITHRNVRTALNKIALSILILKMQNAAYKKLKKNHYDAVYGYEIHGVLALNLLRLSGRLAGIKRIHRFQGSWLPKYLKEKNLLKIITNLDAVISSKLNADAVIMTDDGTQGDLLFKKNKNFHFWVNGVDRFKKDFLEVEKIKKCYNITNQKILLSVSRLESWKRVDRCIEIVNLLVKKQGFTDLKYLIVGGGSDTDRLKKLVNSYSLEDYIIFTGPVSNDKAIHYFGAADVFLSMYDLSNVGNPLLEAIRSNKIIFTIDNGDTAKWIEHGKTGFIYEPGVQLYENVCRDLFEILNNPDRQNEIKENVGKLEHEKLWTWEERFDAETTLVRNTVMNK